MERRSFLRGAGLALAAAGAAPAARAAEGAPPPSAADPSTVPGPQVRQRPSLAPIARLFAQMQAA